MVMSSRDFPRGLVPVDFINQPEVDDVDMEFGVLHDHEDVGNFLDRGNFSVLIGWVFWFLRSFLIPLF